MIADRRPQHAFRRTGRLRFAAPARDAGRHPRNGRRQTPATSRAATPPASSHCGAVTSARQPAAPASSCGSSRAHTSRSNPGLGLGHRRRLDQLQHAAELGVGRLAVPARGEMILDPQPVVAVDFAVVVKNQFFFGQVSHVFHISRGSDPAVCPTNGPSATRILRTALKMPCLVALVFSPSLTLTSLIDIPSMCRSVNAARSSDVSRVSACLHAVVNLRAGGQAIRRRLSFAAALAQRPLRQIGRVVRILAMTAGADQID